MVATATVAAPTTAWEALDDGAGVGAGVAFGVVGGFEEGAGVSLSSELDSLPSTLSLPISLGTSVELDPDPDPEEADTKEEVSSVARANKAEIKTAWKIFIFLGSWGAFSRGRKAAN
jgi:hypothetical protein